MPYDDHLEASYEDRSNDPNDAVEFLGDADNFDVGDERGLLEDDDDCGEQVDPDDEFSLGFVTLLVVRDVIANHNLADALDPRDRFVNLIMPMSSAA
jgi:hypothetical protein